ncbi:hypothetical protein POV27_04575 [Aureisphaera galaxeae]|uniref:helix-turn-helix transcriptional regulator n=1 Tax=Aureisphaera galaxeae TaxID=1538023 RepID=UPI0023506D93|nr:hypothetical protein [Aureisphaera galaxeae]MDC8003312.1 hypothetical protein [Aureisphaera galaxeae]
MRHTTHLLVCLALFCCTLLCVAQNNSTPQDSLQLEELIKATPSADNNSPERTKQLLAEIDALKAEMQRSMDSMQTASERKIEKLEKQKKANTVFWSLICGLILMLAVSTMTYYRSEEKIKEQAYQNLLLNNKVATKEEEVNKLLAETIQHIKSKEQIAENLQKLSKEEEGVTLRSIIADINASKVDDSKLMLVKQNIEQANYEFIKALKSAHPDLSKTDIEVCSFIRIGLDRNEISKLRNTSVEAVRKSRHRIRKKMALEDHIDLNTYLSEEIIPDVTEI